MSNMIRTPIDLTGEQKTILAVLSFRQFILVFPMAMFSLFNLVILNYPFITGWYEFFLKIFITLFLNGITCALAFIKMEKHDCYLSTYITRRIAFLKSQKNYSN